MTLNLPSNYIEREPVTDLDLVSRMHGRFKGTGLVLPDPQRKIYENLRDQFLEDIKLLRGFPKVIHRPTVVDVGCGLGVGSNILSREAEFVWAIDSNEESINFARQLFARDKNNIYYTPQLTFDVVNALDEPRELMTFDYVACVEVFEHIPRTGSVALLQFLNRFVHKGKNGPERTKIYLTTPNRNNPNLQPHTPKNEHHAFEPTAAEMYEFLIKHYAHVTVMDVDFQLQDLDTQATPLVYRLEVPL